MNARECASLALARIGRLKDEALREDVGERRAEAVSAARRALRRVIKVGAWHARGNSAFEYRQKSSRFDPHTNKKRQVSPGVELRALIAETPDVSVDSRAWESRCSVRLTSQSRQAGKRAVRFVSAGQSAVEVTYRGT
eukprot:2098490-Pleurochrysis_carterae.AAC.2